MVDVYGNNIIGAYTGGVAVNEIWCQGVKVWPTDVPPGGSYYISWTPTTLSGSFSMEGNTYNLEDYSGYFSFNGGAITVSAFRSVPLTTMETNAVTLEASCFRNCSSLSSVKIPEVTEIGSWAFRTNAFSIITGMNCSVIGEGAFYDCNSLKSVTFPVCNTVSDMAFAYCTLLNYVYLPQVKSIGAKAFEGDVYLRTINFPQCEYVGSSAFFECSRMFSVRLAECKYIGDYGFAGGKPSFASVSLPKCSYIGHNAFAAAGLVSMNTPVVEYIGERAFLNCSSLTSADFPVTSRIEASAFFGCENLSRIDLPECKYMGDNAFRKCLSLTSLDLPKCSNIGSTAFYNCVELSLVILRSNRVCQLGVNAFDATPIQFSGSTGSILVPSSLVSAYKSAPNWSRYSSRIYPITT